MNVSLHDELAAYSVNATVQQKLDNLEEKKYSRIHFHSASCQVTVEEIVRRVEPSLRKWLFLTKLDRKTQDILDALAELADSDEEDEASSAAKEGFDKNYREDDNPWFREIGVTKCVPCIIDTVGSR